MTVYGLKLIMPSKTLNGKAAPDCPEKLT